VLAKVVYHALRVIAVETFHHLHALSLRFHLERHTGGLSRIVDRGTKAIDRLLTLAIFNIFPTALQLIIISVLLWRQFSIWFMVIMFAMIAATPISPLR
jgi:ATP-binding cassette subfamily B protein